MRRVNSLRSAELWGSAFWLVLLSTTFILFFYIGNVPLLDPDEPVYAETAKEMLQHNDFISPRIYGEFWYDKPPMYYWLVAGAFELFGVSEFAARLPSALLAVICVMYVYYMGAKLFGGSTGIFSALILATSIEFFYLAKAAVTDITLTLCLTVALLSFLRGQYYLFYLFAALATVTKGPVGLLFPGAIVFLFLMFTRNFAQLRHMKIPVGLIIYAFVALPWYILMYRYHGSAFIDTFLGFHNITRFTSPEHPEGVLWYYFIPVLIAGFFPWTSILVQSIWVSLTRSYRDYPALLFLNIWAAFIFVFFTISQTKLVSYILPMYPALALIAGWYLNRSCETHYRRRLWSWPVVLTGVVLVFAIGIVVGLRQMPELSFAMYTVLILLVIMTIGVWYWQWRWQVRTAFAVQVVAMTFFVVILMTLIFPTIAPQFSSCGIAGEFQRHHDGQSPVYVIKFLHPGFTYYSGIYGIEVKGDGETREELQAKVAENGKAYFVIRALDYRHLTASERNRLTLVASSADKMLLLRQ